MEGLVAELLEGAREELARVEEQGGAVEAVPYMKASLVESHRERIRRIESGEQVLVGVNRYEETEPSPLTEDGGIMVVDPAVEAEALEALAAWRLDRDGAAVQAALAELARVAASDENVMPATIAAARAGATTGEWAATLRDAFGSYRAPTGVGEAAAPAPGEELAALREDVAALSESLGRTLKILVGKPGLDGHSNGAEQIAVRARDAGMEVVYEGIRLTPSQIARSAVDEGVHVIGLSILSGSHRELIPSVIAGCARPAAGTSRSSSAGSSPTPTSPRCARRASPRLHAEGLRAHAHPARRGGAGRGAQRHHQRRGDAGGAALAITCDVTDESSCRAAVAEAADRLGGIDGLVYTPGIGPLTRLVDAGAELWRRVFDTNVTGAAVATAAALPALIESRGKAVYLSSIQRLADGTVAGVGPYAVSKAALDKLVEAWRVEHPEVGFTRVVVGNCAGGEGDAMTGFSTGWDMDLAAEIMPMWAERGAAATWAPASSTSTTSSRPCDAVLRSGASMGIPTVTLTPRPFAV